MFLANQLACEAKFCPSVFIYLGLVVPAIWLLELHKVDLRLQKLVNDTVVETDFPIPGASKIPTDTWVTLIEQFLMLTLIVGRWLLPKGDLTRDQLSQLLLVYIEQFLMLTLIVGRWLLPKGDLTRDQLSQLLLVYIEQFLMLTLVVGRWLLPKGDLTRDQLSQLLLVYIGRWLLPKGDLTRDQLSQLLLVYIEQFLMLTLIVGRWLLPKGDLTRDQLSQLLLVYIGTAADIIEFFESFKDEKVATEKVLVLLTLAIWSWSLMQFTVVLMATKSTAADIIEFFDSFKDEKVATEKVLVLLTLAIWSWSLMQFTVVLTATKSRKSRGTANRSDINSRACCCSIEVCAIMMNIALQDAPFLAFRLLIICHYKIINYMNMFFTCKNTLVILLQIYRLYVLHLETVDEGNGGSVYIKKTKHRNPDKKEKDKKHSKHKSKKHKRKHEIGETSISVISDRRHDRGDAGRIRAIILTNSDEIKELELSKLFKDQISTENEKKKGSKKKQKSESSEESLNNVHHTTDDSGI
ncbi:hypothetical protein PYW07_012641 [Mythimna separata]|uniref:Transmembrane protein 26 n=1 Tax=Mythimna separata TaxID=271217 RepID=A0AAD7Y8D2_MYTSE|nr:hypothetical protein PYW07_012641 [Mythimna separata]